MWCHSVINKKVLLREHKRHTAHHISSAQGVPGPRSGGVPSPRSRGVPHPWSGGYPISGPVGYPGYPPDQTWDGVPPSPQPDLGWGTPLPPATRPEMGYPPAIVIRQTFPSINITFPRTMYEAGNNAKNIYDCLKHLLICLFLAFIPVLLFKNLVVSFSTCGVIKYLKQSNPVSIFETGLVSHLVLSFEINFFVCSNLPTNQPDTIVRR